VSAVDVQVPDRDQLLDGAKVPWDFVSGQTERTAPDLPRPAPRTPEQTTRRRLIAAGRWRRP
jgi:hypothetical protein